MRKFKKFTAAMLATALMVQGTALFPVANAESAEEVKYTGLISEGDDLADFQEDGSATWIIDADDIYNSNEEIVSYNATEFRKMFEINDEAMIPEADFTFYVVPGEESEAEFDDDKNIIKLAVKEGVGADKITFKQKNVDQTANSFDDDNSDDKYEPLDTTASDGISSFTLSYDAQAVVLPEDADKGESSYLAVPEDEYILINNINEENGSDTENTYYAIKAVQFDFSECGFTEPGIYRYYIYEDEGDTAGVTYGNNVCTLDVYVEDATYVLDENDEPGDKVHELKIAGYVLYNDELDEGPVASEDPEKAIVEDAEKTDGIVNRYNTVDFTFKKTVSGNQASNDQFFKFNLYVDGDFDDDAYFMISEDSTHVVNSSWKDDDDTPNSATVYSKGEIYGWNSAEQKDPDDDDIVDYTAISGWDLKHGYDFFLQADQYITILGLPEGVTYELLEYYEDYTPSVELEDGEGYDDYDEASDEVIDEPELIVATDGNAARISDSEMTGSVSATFNNEKKGTIPTGIIMHVLPVAALAVVFGSGVIIFAARRRNDDEE